MFCMQRVYGLIMHVVITVRAAALPVLELGSNMRVGASGTREREPITTV